jgi:multifunctional methyltransferase subunit TRM112
MDHPEAAAVRDRDVEFVKRILPTLEWPALVQAAADVGIPTLPPSLTVEVAEDEAFLKALYHIMMNVHLIRGMLTCPVTGREFPVTDGIPNMMLEEEECEKVRL